MTAVWSRRLQFRAGPESMVFHACAEHEAALRDGDISCFFGVDSDPMVAEDPDEEIACDLCREG